VQDSYGNKNILIIVNKLGTYWTPCF